MVASIAAEAAGSTVASTSADRRGPFDRSAGSAAVFDGRGLDLVPSAGFVPELSRPIPTLGGSSSVIFSRNDFPQCLHVGR